MAERYNVYFAGQVKEGQDLGLVREKLARLFNADQPTLDKLFNGKVQLVKGNCDQQTALKYQEAMERAGAQPIIKATELEPAVPQAGHSAAASAADKIAALAATTVEARFDANAANQSSGAQHTEVPAQPGAISLAPPGTDVLRASERAMPFTREVDTSALTVDPLAQRLSPEPPPPPAAPDTTHLSMGKVGETIPTLPSSAVPLSPNLDGLELSPRGTDFSDCAAPEPEVLPLDLSALAVEPPGAQLLEDQYRGREEPVAPSTDHISLKD